MTDNDKRQDLFLKGIDLFNKKEGVKLSLNILKNSIIEELRKDAIENNEE